MSPRCTAQTHVTVAASGADAQKHLLKQVLGRATMACSDIVPHTVTRSLARTPKSCVHATAVREQVAIRPPDPVYRQLSQMAKAASTLQDLTNTWPYPVWYWIEISKVLGAVSPTQRLQCCREGLQAAGRKAIIVVHIQHARFIDCKPPQIWKTLPLRRIHHVCLPGMQ
jgi:hypothetical protein